MCYGRRRIFTDETEISTDNVIAEVEAAFLVHSDNRAEVEKFYQYYRNKTDIEKGTQTERTSTIKSARLGA